MIDIIDRQLDRITMYRLVLYYLIGLLGAAVILSAANLLPYNPAALLYETGILIGICWVINVIFAWTFQAQTNVESVYITALILALIISPPETILDVGFLVWAAIWAMASKYIVAINKKHLFNPAAFAVALTAISIGQNASWWVGTKWMLPLVLVGGVLLVRKLRRFHLVLSFLLTTVLSTLVMSLYYQVDGGLTMRTSLLYSPLLFFAFVILTEPLTMPHTKKLQVYYGALVGFLFTPLLHLGSLYLTPELAILGGNIFSYLVSPKAKLILRLQEKVKIAPDIYDFIFVPTQKLAFAPGQYMEWTLGHKHPDSRGNRRYFTLASSPTENTLRIGVKFYPDSSSYKRSMLSINNDSEIVAAQLAGDFVLPKNPTQKCVFIAGGIGITPFRSMIKYLLDTHQRRPIVLFYTSKSIEDIVYKEIFDEARVQLGIKTIYSVTNQQNLPASWNGYVGRITPQIIRKEVPDYADCTFYLSGPNAMVNSFRELLHEMNVPSDQIKMDFFAGFA